MSFLSNKTKETINIPSKGSGNYKDLQKLNYDYSQLGDEELARWLSNCTMEIRGRQYRSMKEVYLMGKLLIQVKEKIGHGHYRNWLTQEFIEPRIFGVSTAENYCSVANAVDTFGFDKLQYFAVSAIYLVSKTRDKVDEEFQEYILDKSQNMYIETGKTLGRKEIKAQKERFKIIKNLQIDERKQDELLESAVPTEVLKQINKQPDKETQKALVAEVITKDTVTSTKLKPVIDLIQEDKSSFQCIKKLDYVALEKYLGEESTETELVFIQHSLDREGGDINKLVELFKNKAKTIVTLTVPMDTYLLKPVEGYVVRNLAYSRRPQHRLWSALNIINHLFCFTIYTQHSCAKFPLDDYFDSTDYAIEKILKAYCTSAEKDIVFTHSGNTAVDRLIYNDNLLAKVSEQILNNIVIFT